jgi:hypothetical protein
MASGCGLLINTMFMVRGWVALVLLLLEFVIWLCYEPGAA